MQNAIKVFRSNHSMIVNFKMDIPGNILFDFTHTQEVLPLHDQRDEYRLFCDRNQTVAK